MMPYMNALKTGLEAQNQPSTNNLTRVPPEQAPVAPPKPTKWETSDYSNMDWGINWDKPSSYTPTNEYVRPWDREGWGADDVVVTPPRNPGGYVPPSRPGIQEGQKDYVFMPTEKEQWRTRDENKRRQALAVGKDWREARLPRKEKEATIQPVYGDWREAEIPERREVNIQPVPRRDREWGESRPDEAYIQIEGPGNPSWERRNPRGWKLTHRGGNRRPSLRDTLMRDMGRRYR
tara:strand:+ start:486 stop:1187 length:702 start_codon:yes stop_codon:yes gene_type:complete